MATVHRAFGFRFVIYVDDHEPAHVHVLGHGGEAKVWITGAMAGRFDRILGLTDADLRRIRAEVLTMQPVLLQRWNGIHGAR